MIRRALVTLIAVLTCAVTASAASIELPAVQLAIDGHSITGLPAVQRQSDVMFTFEADGSVFLDRTGDYTFGDGSVLPGDGSVKVADVALSATMDVDPLVTYSWTVISAADTPMTFGFLFLSPFAGGPYAYLAQSIEASVGKGSATNVLGGGAADPFLGTPIPILCSSALASGEACSASRSDAVATALAGLFTGGITLDVGAGTDVTGDGSVELTNEAPVPEPATTLLLGAGAAAVRLRYRKLRAARRTEGAGTTALAGH